MNFERFGKSWLFIKRINFLDTIDSNEILSIIRKQEVQKVTFSNYHISVIGIFLLQIVCCQGS